MGYYDAPEDWVCPICEDEGCEGCPGYEHFLDTTEPDWVLADDDDDGLTRQDYIEIELDILLERDEKDDTDFIVKTYLA